MAQDSHGVNHISMADTPGMCWAIPLSYFATVWQNLPLQNFLKPSRLKRVCNFYDERDQIRTAGAEIWLRLMLSLLMNRFPRDIDIIFGKFKKPRLRILGKIPSFYFNIAHSGNWIIVAISNKAEVGIDVEKIDNMSADLYETILAEEEQKALCKGLNGNIKETLTHYWVGKEAYTKLMGRGLSMAVKNVILQDIKKLSSIRYNAKPTPCWLRTDKLDSLHCWALATYSQNVTLRMAQNLIYVDEDYFQKMMRPYLTTLFVQ